MHARTLAAARILTLSSCLTAGLALTAAAPPQAGASRLRASSAAAEPPARALIDQYCVTCHNARLNRGNLVLEGKDLARVGEDAETWEKVIRKLNVGLMPPPGMPRPDAGTTRAFVASLESALDRAAASAPNPGRRGIHRLNRVEYANAIRDLIGLDVRGSALLPPDDASFGFDNIADALSVSPGLLEQYMNAATKISRLVIGDATMPPVTVTHSVPFFQLQEDRASEDLPFGSRGGLAVQHYFPLDGEYEMQIRLQRRAVNVGGGIRGLDERNQIDVWVDGERIKTFTIGGGKAEQDLDVDDSPSTLATGPFVPHRSRGQQPFSETELERFADDPLNFRFLVKAGERLVAVSFQRNMWIPEGPGMTRLPVASYGFVSPLVSGLSGKVDMGIDHIDLRGPFEGLTPGETRSYQKVFLCQPSRVADEERCARRIVSALARRAYRRPVSDADVQPLLALYQEGRKEGTFATGVQWAIERILVDPDFLYRVERDAPNHTAGTAVPAAARARVFPITDLELASRLSFFLWSSIPDDELLGVAARGQLRQPGVLDQQVRRMLKDAKASALVDGFFSQWLWLRNLANVAPNTTEFPQFDEELRAAFKTETELFLASQLREDRSMLELLTANYTFANERLAKHYGIPNVYGSHFRRVTLPGDTRAGLLGHGSILMVTSYADRTSPVVRGKYILENMLGARPPDPPAVVPPFPENDGKTGPRTVRARLEEHRKNPTCAACHSQMDPLGFGLENFDGIGAYRTVDAGNPIDATGTLPGGSAFKTPAQYRAGLLEHEAAFTHTLIEKFLTYALGRGAEYYDMPVVRQLAHETAAADYRWSALVLGIVKSAPFQMRRLQ